jgi:hypothetical protein
MDIIVFLREFYGINKLFKASIVSIRRWLIAMLNWKRNKLNTCMPFSIPISMWLSHHVWSRNISGNLASVLCRYLYVKKLIMDRITRNKLYFANFMIEKWFQSLEASSSSGRLDVQHPTPTLAPTFYFVVCRHYTDRNVGGDRSLSNEETGTQGGFLDRIEGPVKLSLH